MLKRIGPAALAVLAGALLLAGCFQGKKSHKDIGNALLLEPVSVTDSDMVSLSAVPGFPEPNRRVAVLLGYGYNDADFVASMRERLSRSFGLADDGGSVIPMVFPDDFGRGSSARISLLPSMLRDSRASALVIVGAPEGTHRALASMQDSGGGSIGYPVISLLPQDDVLGMEASCDLVLDYLPAASTEEGFGGDSEAFLDNVPSLVERAVHYASLVPPDATDGFGETLRELTMHARLLAGDDWVVSQYIDPESGIRPRNHFVIERAVSGTDGE